MYWEPKQGFIVLLIINMLQFGFAALYGIYSSFIYFDLNQHSQLFKQALLSCIAAHCVPSTEKGLFWSWWYKVAVPNAKTLVSKSLIKTCDNNLALHSRLKLNLRKTRGTLWKYRGDETITFVNQKSKKPKSKSYKDTFVLNWFIFCDPFTQIWVLKVRLRRNYWLEFVIDPIPTCCDCWKKNLSKCCWHQGIQQKC